MCSMKTQTQKMTSLEQKLTEEILTNPVIQGSSLTSLWIQLPQQSLPIPCSTPGETQTSPPPTQASQSQPSQTKPSAHQTQKSKKLAALPCRTLPSPSTPPVQPTRTYPSQIPPNPLTQSSQACRTIPGTPSTICPD